MLYEVIDYLPTIPKELIEDLSSIIDKSNLFDGEAQEEQYASYPVSQELYDFIQQHFEYPVIVRYQVIQENLKIHVDKDVEEKYNYIIEAGGNNVITLWHRSKFPKSIYAKLNAQPNTWYLLNVKFPHSVQNVEKPRISITVKRNDK